MVKQECLTRVSSKKCQVRVSHQVIDFSIDFVDFPIFLILPMFFCIFPLFFFMSPMFLCDFYTVFMDISNVSVDFLLIFQCFSRMRSEGSRFMWGSGGEAVFAESCASDRNRLRVRRKALHSGERT